MTGTIKFPAEADRSCERPGNEDTRLHISEMYTGAESWRHLYASTHSL